MKYVLFIVDGMNDRPIKELNGLTPMEAAHKPFMDALAPDALVGLVKNIPRGFKPGSDVAIMSMLGFSPKTYYTGRGPLEAANLGIELNDNQVVFRCNLVTTSGDRMVDYSAGHIKREEAKVLMQYLNEKLTNEKLRFYSGISYRNLLLTDGIGDELNTTPPHDIMGESLVKHLPKGKDEDVICDLMYQSQEILASHDINRVRLDLGENPANMIWLWGQGRRPNFPTFQEKYSLDGFVISAVDLVNGLGRLLGLKVVDVPGATGYYDTNYEGKGKYAVNNLKKHDFCFLHLEATDEAGHNGDLREKIKAIESFDNYILGPVYDYISKSNEDFRILISSDHATPVSIRTHTDEAVAFLCYGTGIAPRFKVDSFNEKNAKATLVEYAGPELIEEVFLGE
ncbi:MAG: cofactor-independent phosphoglycerate mutase [Candidatus Saelkia tenebricola]|nr:cofactor-independent phosphoglycerate mutase [Candidatus Saelkia tenebricola]